MTACHAGFGTPIDRSIVVKTSEGRSSLGRVRSLAWPLHPGLVVGPGVGSGAGSGRIGFCTAALAVGIGRVIERMAGRGMFIVRSYLTLGSAPSMMIWLARVIRYKLRACRQLSQQSAATKWNAARKFLAVLSYRVAMPRNCLAQQKKFSIK